MFFVFFFFKQKTAYEMRISDWSSDVCSAEKPDCVTWFRAGSAGMDEHASLFWNGDQLVDVGAEAGLASALLGTFSAGVSGWPLVHSDIGGYTSINAAIRSEEHTSEPQSLMRISYAVFCLQKKKHI